VPDIVPEGVDRLEADHQGAVALPGLAVPEAVDADCEGLY